MNMIPTTDDRLAAIIEAAIGGNDPYPDQVQLAAHRAKQALKEKQFLHIESKEVIE